MSKKKNKDKFSESTERIREWKYKARTSDDKIIRDSGYAHNEDELRNTLLARDVYLISAHPAFSFNADQFTTIKLTELQTFCKQLAVMHKALKGDLTTCLGELAAAPFSHGFKPILRDIYEDVKTGVSLADAMGKYKRIFPEFFREMVRVGEESRDADALSKILISLSDYYQEQVELRHKLSGALAYPIMLVVMAIGLIVLMFAYVIPQFQEALESMEVDMPALTMVIFNMASWVVKYKFVILGVFLGIVIVLVIFLNTKTGKYVKSWVALHFFISHGIIVSLLCSKMAMSLGLLLDSGVPLIKALKTTQNVLGNKVYIKKFDKVIEMVNNGESLPNAIEKEGLFDNTLRLLLKVGDKTGNIGEPLLSSSSYFHDAAIRAMNAMVGVIQPILLIFMGGAIGTMFIAVYSPMISIMNTLL